ncbi:hypothetical protein J4462_02410 [Candidatus Pacearchaeota archaeon]|nr:hypothetical protein [Candidatus Pacearchaeota archaeon]
MKKNHVLRFGLAGLLALSPGCAGFGMYEDEDGQAHPIPMNANAGDMTALAGFLLTGVGMHKERPDAAALGGMLSEYGVRRSVAEVGRYNVQQNVYVRGGKNTEDNEHSAYPRFSAFSGKWQDIDSNRKPSPKEIFDKETYGLNDEIVFGIDVFNSFGLLTFRISDSHGRDSHSIHRVSGSNRISYYYNGLEPGDYKVTWSLNDVLLTTSRIEVR